MKTILVTGGTGLVGKALQNLNNKDYKWIFISSNDVNLTVFDEVDIFFNKIRPNIVIHLAANVGGLYKNIKEPVNMFNINMEINMNVLKCCKKYNIEKGILCLSTCIFPNNIINYPITENMLHNGEPHYSNYAYAYSKRMLDILGKCYNQQYNTKFISIIPTNIYGENDNYNIDNGHVIPSLIHKCYLAKQLNKPFIINGDGKSLRQYIYSNDLAKLIIWCLEYYNDYKETIILADNIETEISIETIVNYIIKIMKYEGEIIYDTKYSNGQYKKTVSNNKLKDLLLETNNKFKFTNIEEGLEKTIYFFLNNYNIIRK